MEETTARSATNPVAQCIWNYKDEAEYARRNRYIQNRMNFEAFHLRQDYSHKKRGQSKEFLPKQPMAVEQLASFLQQGLMDFGEWFEIEPQPGVNPDKLKILPEEIKHLLARQLELNKFPNFFNDGIKLGLLGSLMIFKVGGRSVKKTEYESRTSSAFGIFSKKKELFKKERDVWQLDLNLVRQEDYFPDPNINPGGRKLYEMQRIEMDWHELYELAKANPKDFDMDAVMAAPRSEDDLQKAKKARETGQNVTYSLYRRRVTIFECWGTLVERYSGKIIEKDCVCAIDYNSNVIMPPRKNPYWHGESPFVTSPIIRVPLSVWHKALMDATTRLNNAENELFNLNLDASMMEVHGIKQLHTAWLENPGQVQNGIPPGETLLVNSQCPPGAKVLERVDTSSLTPQALNMMQVVNRELQESALTNDTRVGATPQRQVKATEIVASNQALTGIMNGIVKVIEEEAVAPLLDKCWMVMAQHMNDLDSDEMKALLGEDRARIISSMSPEDVFAETAKKHDYKVFGLSMTLNKIQDFRKIQSLLQSIGASPQMMQEFMRKYSMTKLLGEIIKSLDIDEEKISMDPEEKAQHEKEAALAMQQQQMQMQAKGGGNTQGGQGTNPQSQIPQASASTHGDAMAAVRGMNNIGMTKPA